MTVPDWYTVDNAAKTVHLAVTSGATPLNNYWNYNGFIKGQIAITVPAGYTVSIDWCGAFPELWTWNPYTTTNIGTNITVSAVAEGIPIVFTHGARNGFDPYAGTPYGAFVW